MEIKVSRYIGAPRLILGIIFNKVIKSHTDKPFEYECYFFWHESHLFTTAYT